MRDDLYWGCAGTLELACSVAIVNNQPEATTDQSTIERQYKLLVLAADVTLPHLGELRTTTPVSVKQLTPVRVFVLAAECLPGNQMMETMLVKDYQARDLECLLVNVCVIRIVPLMINAEVKWIVAVDEVKLTRLINLIAGASLPVAIELLHKNRDLGSDCKVGEELSAVVGDT